MPETAAEAFFTYNEFSVLCLRVMLGFPVILACILLGCMVTDRKRDKESFRFAAALWVIVSLGMPAGYAAIGGLLSLVEWAMPWPIQ